MAGEDTWWEVRALPILTVVAADDGATRLWGVKDLAERAGVDPHGCREELKRLLDEGYVRASNSERLNHREVEQAAISGLALTGGGPRVVKEWPTSDAFARLLAAIDAQIAAESDPDKKSRLSRFREAATGLTVELAAKFGAELAKSMTGIG